VIPPPLTDEIVVRSRDRFPVALFALDQEGNFSFWNREFLDLLGLTETPAQAKDLPKILKAACPFPQNPEAHSAVESHWRHENGSVLAVEVQFSLPPEGSPHTLMGSVREISRRREAQAEVNRLSSLNDLLIRANELLALETDEDVLLKKILDLLDRRLSLPLLRFLNPWRKGGPLSIVPSRLAREEPGLDALLSVLAQNGQSLLAQVFSQGEIQTSDLEDTLPSSPWEETLHRRGIRHLMALPVRKNGEVFLALFLASSREEGFPKGLDQALSGLGKTLSKTLDRLSLESKIREESMIQKALLDNSLSGAIILKNRIIQNVNAPLLRMLGYDRPEEVIGQSVSILYYDQDEFVRTGKDLYSRMPNEESIRYNDLKARKKQGGFIWVDVSATLVGEGDETFVVISLQDAQLRHEQTDKLSLLARYNQLLARINALISEDPQESVLLKGVCGLSTELTGLTMVRISCPDSEGWLTTVSSAGGDKAEPNFRISVRGDRPEGQGAYGKVWRERDPLFGIDFSKVALNYSSPQREWLLSTGFKSSSFLPLFRNGKIWGIIAFHDTRPEIFAPELCGVLLEIARTLSAALDRIDLKSRERESAAIIRALFEKTSSGIMMARDRRVIMVNDQLVRLFGYDGPQEMTSRDSSYLYATPEEYHRVGGMLYPAILEAQGVSVPDIQARKKDGTLLWVDLFGSSLDLGDERTLIFTLNDATARHEQEERLSRLSLFTQVLADFRRLAVSAKTENELLDGVCRLSAEGAISDIVWIGRPDSDGCFSFEHSAGESGWLEGVELSVREEIPEGQGAAGAAWRDNEPRFNVSLDPTRRSLPPSWKTIIDDRGIRSTAAVPVRKHGSPFAILAFLDRRPEAFSLELRQILVELGESLSEGLDRLDLMTEQKRLASAVDSVGEGVLVVSTDMKILYANPTMGEMIGRPSPELVGETPYILVGDETDMGTVEKILEAFRTGIPFKEKLLTYRKDGSTFWNLLSINPIFDDSGDVREFVGIHRNITEIVEASKKFEYEALHDKLTGLPNRHAFELHLKKALARAKRSGETLSVGFIDLDDFKPINDRYGHELGDVLLREFATRALSMIRETDFFGRLGGDEFVFVLESMGDNDDGLQERLGKALERIHGAVLSPFEIAPRIRVTIGMSMGLALFPSDGESADDLLRKADLAMYRSKGEKLSRTHWWSRYRSETSERDREEDFDIYGEQAIALLDRYRTLFDEVTRQFATTFYDRLATNPQAFAILENLTPARRERLVESQTRHLKLLLSPDTLPGTINETAKALGTIHALVGVSVPLILSARSLYSNIFFEKIARASLSTSDRLRLLLLFENRLGEDIRGQVESYGLTIETYSDSLASSPPPPGTPWPDILAREIAALENLPGISGAILLRPDRQGSFSVESSSRIPFPWENPEHQQSLKSSWNENRQIRIHCPDQRPVEGTPEKAWCASLFLPVRDETGRPAATLFLAGTYPHQFDSAWSGRFIAALSQRWSELWNRSQTAPRSLDGDSSRTLRKELLEGGLRLYMQPVVDLKMGTVTRVEALARLERPGGEILTPGIFLPLLGESDLIWLFREGLELSSRQLSDWDRQGLSLDLSLNLPPHALSDERCPRWVMEPLDRYGISPSRISLELLENQRMDPRTQSEGIRRIMETGVKLSIDDLGSGYSTLERLASIPFDTIKVDQGLLFRFYSSPLETLALVGAIVDLGRDFNHHVVIEGLGHPDLVEVARHLGARYGQGFALARPMAPGEIPSFVRGFRLPTADRAIKSAAGALAYLWRTEIRGMDRLSEDSRECPLRRWISSRESPGSLPLLWHDGIHSDPNRRELFLENLKGWIAKKVRQEEPDSL
jgi:diguanylate cyclase (GGDEF)-like protein/PAS domain S-box-containing protein